LAEQIDSEADQFVALTKQEISGAFGLTVPAWGREHAASGSLVVTLRSGERLNYQVPHAIGHPGNPLSDDALVDKFVACAARATLSITEPNARSAAAQVFGLSGRSSATSLLRPA
jgi:2-methylcitrate dehydratase PrpD